MGRPPPKACHPEARSTQSNEPTQFDSVIPNEARSTEPNKPTQLEAVILSEAQRAESKACPERSEGTPTNPTLPQPLTPFCQQPRVPHPSSAWVGHRLRKQTTSPPPSTAVIPTGARSAQRRDPRICLRPPPRPWQQTTSPPQPNLQPATGNSPTSRRRPPHPSPPQPRPGNLGQIRSPPPHPESRRGRTGPRPHSCTPPHACRTTPSQNEIPPTQSPHMPHPPTRAA
jgi:hypothetical protein